MTVRIPPIQCLLSFEALARLRSVTQTAEELFVTPSAVSHRIKQLEQMVGTPLFGRSDFSLTVEGSEYLAHVREGLSNLQRFPGQTPVWVEANCDWLRHLLLHVPFCCRVLDSFMRLTPKLT